MIQRSHKLSKTHSFFLFGPRGSGKSTLLNALFPKADSAHWWIDLLNLDTEMEYRTKPQLLVMRYEAQEKKPDWIIVDEVQKVPAILDAVHQLIENHNVKFALTGSSARKLKRAQANMLGGRAFDFALFPLTFQELQSRFDLNDVLRFGTLPSLFSEDMSEVENKRRYLKSYVNTYLKEEILVEQIVRKLEPFHRFLGVAAQVNGDILNYSKIGREANINDKNAERYFEILSDTLMGVFLPSYHKSVRKQQIEASKFYFFDTGVVRALRGHLNYDITPGTYDYGKLFESFVIMEIHKINSYRESDYKFSFLKTKEGREIDLIVEKPNGETVLIEIKSKEVSDIKLVPHIQPLLPSFPNAKGLVLCNNSQPIKLNDHVIATSWREGIDSLFGSAARGI